MKKTGQQRHEEYVKAIYLLKACTDILSAHRIWWERRNTGAMRDGKRFVRFSRPGTADVFALPHVKEPACYYKMHPNRSVSELVRVAVTVPLWLELKSDSGRQTEKQKEFQKEVEAAGHSYLLVRKPEELLAWLKRNGAM